MAASPDAMIEGLDVLVAIAHRLSYVDVLLDPFLLQAAEKRFSHRVVPAMTPSTPAGFSGRSYPAPLEMETTFTTWS